MIKKWRKEEEEYKSKSRERHASKHQQQDKIQLDMSISLFDSDESFGTETPVTSTPLHTSEQRFVLGISQRKTPPVEVSQLHSCT